MRDEVLQVLNEQFAVDVTSVGNLANCAYSSAVLQQWIHALSLEYKEWRNIVSCDISTNDAGCVSAPFIAC